MGRQVENRCVESAPVAPPEVVSCTKRLFALFTSTADSLFSMECLRGNFKKKQKKVELEEKKQHKKVHSIGLFVWER